MTQKMQVNLVRSLISLVVLTCVDTQAQDPLAQAIKEAQPVEVMNLLENPFVKNSLNYEEKKWYARLAHKIVQDKAVQCAQSSLDRYDLGYLALGTAVASLGIGVIYGANEEFITEDPALLVQPRGRALLTGLGALVSAWGIHQINKGFSKDRRYQNYIKALAVQKLLEQK